MKPEFWSELEEPGPETALVAGVELRRGSRVVLRPGGGADVFDLALAGRVATVEALERDAEGAVHVAVTLDDDPGRDLGEARLPGHRFFFRTDEVEPLAAAPAPAPRHPRVLVAGIGNVFLGDDGFGVEVAAELGRRTLPRDVDVCDFGIRGLDLAYALQEPYEAVVLVDAAPRGEAPGTVSVLEPDLGALGAEEATVDAHGLDPVRVLALAQRLGRVPPRVLVVACEPQVVLSGDDDELVGGLSEPVRAAVEPAARTVETLLDELLEREGKRMTERW